MKLSSVYTKAMRHLELIIAKRAGAVTLPPEIKKNMAGSQD